MNIEIIEIYDILKKSITDEYAKILIENDEFIDFVVENIMSTSCYEEDGMYNDADIKLAIGRAILYKYNTEI